MGGSKPRRSAEPFPWVRRPLLNPGRDGDLRKGAPPGGGLKGGAEAAEGDARWARESAPTLAQLAGSAGTPDARPRSPPQPCPGLRCAETQDRESPGTLRLTRDLGAGRFPPHFKDSGELAPPSHRGKGLTLWAMLGRRFSAGSAGALELWGGGRRRRASRRSP